MDTRHALATVFALVLIAPPAAAQTLDFGDDSSEYANDSECDDPRFAGTGMATSLSAEDRGRDATDCRRLFELGAIRLVRTRAETSVAECTGIDFGDNSSTWARDGECDDPRFTGGGAAETLLIDDLGTDADDCRKLCDAGEVWLR